MNIPEIERTPLEGLLLIRPKTFPDQRGRFYESWTLSGYKEAGVDADFIQDDCSFSRKNVLRGLHLQKSQSKMLWVTYGHVFQVSVDLRPDSKTYGQHFSIELTHEDVTQVFLPSGFANGFCVLSDIACMNYKCSQYYAPHDEAGVIWSDKDIDIKWPVTEPIVSEKDQNLPGFRYFNEAVN